MNYSAISWVIRNGALVASRDGQKVWQGRPQGIRCLECTPIPEAQDVVVLLDPDSQIRGPFKNVCRVRVDGSVLWWADLPTTGEDSYVALTQVGQHIFATSWSGYRATIDPVTGKIARSEFVK
jgi:hypothetical protein